MPAAEQLQDALNSLIIDDTSAPPLFGRIVGFIRRVATALVAYVNEYVADARGLDDIPALRARVAALEGRQPSSTSAPTPRQQGAMSSSSATPRNRSIRCNRCHAHGHSQAECKSTNPEVVRKRVAKNKRANAQSSLTASAPLPHPAPFIPPVHALSALASPLDPHYLALAADAAELRRRAVQSSRDKKRIARANRTSAPSTH